MSLYNRKHTPVPRPFEPGKLIGATEIERSMESLVERVASPEELEEIHRKYGKPIIKTGDRKGSPMRKRGGVA
ncbi:hypothetical protein [Paenibacillus dakarensis]|uniref:hypothetical protein n=1 Tax=Paenibacillus dakarensis TaxID=1527293 RepID=UPI0006D56CBD|nr:hypothetical protein [Paenibacillus dakarensis]